MDANFTEIDSKELMEIEGGIGVIIAAIIALAGVGFTGGIAVGLNRKNRK